MKSFFFLCAFVLSFSLVNAQDIRRHKIALFAPLYLDSAFDAGNERFHKTFPRYVNPGLDFFLGAEAALDSLQKRGAPLEVFVYDTKSRTPFSTQLNSRDLADVELLIGQTNVQETRALAELAQQRKAPFFSATLPNDAGVGRNPYFVVLNSGLQTHIESIYRLLQKNFSRQNIIVFKKPGTQEDVLKKYLTDYAKISGGNPVNIRFVDLPENFNANSLSGHLDSTRKNILIAGTVDEKFGQRLVQNLVALKNNFPVTVIGMPTWENMSFGKVPSNVEIIYSSSFHYLKNSRLEKKLLEEYASKTAGKPTDLYFRGYETMLRFALLLLDAQEQVATSLTRKGNYVFNQFDIAPVYRNKNSDGPDYYENKKVYFIKYANGIKSLYF